jgi:hypothetical protein
VSQSNAKDYDATSGASIVGSITAQSTNSSRIQEPRAAKARLEERRSKLLAPQAIDSEEEKIIQELKQLEGQGPGSH